MKFTQPDVCVAISRYIVEALGDFGRPTGGGQSTTRVKEILDPFDAHGFVSQLRRSRAEVRASLRIDEAANLVLMAGRICRNKAQDLLVEAAALPGLENATFVFCGGLPPENDEESSYFAELQQRAEPLGDRIRFLGNREDMVDLINASDVVVLASRHEAFGRVLLEAHALSKPIVATDKGGPSEIVGNNERGFLFDADNAEQLNKVLQTVLASPEVCAERAQAGRKWVEEVCSPTSHATRVQQLWDDVIASSARAA
jgi:glycosyltransferase involved in cell wall biosynthesis